MLKVICAVKSYLSLVRVMFATHGAACMYAVVKLPVIRQIKPLTKRQTSLSVMAVEAEVYNLPRHSLIT